MKKITFIFIIACVTFFLAFRPINKGKTDIPGFSIKEIDKSLAKITDSLYAGKYEVSNILYLYWGYELYKNKQTETYKQQLPDTLNWRDKLAYNEPLVELYFRHPAYRDYPVVNITHEAAEAYCAWLTEKYNADPKRKFRKVLFRLPTEAEWEKAASGGSDASLYPWGIRLTQNNQYMCNYKPIGDELLKRDSLTRKIIVDTLYSSGMAGLVNDAADITAPVASYWPNKFGLYNVCGNVAEMVQEKGISRGGGWKSPGGDVKIKSRAHYTRSASDLGFRYFMQIIEK